MHCSPHCLILRTTSALLQVVLLGTKAQQGEKMKALFQFLDALLTHTDPTEEAYDKVLHYMENLPLSSCM